MFPISEWGWNFEGQAAFPSCGEDEVAALGRERIFGNALQRPRGIHRLEADQKAACGPLERTVYQIYLFFLSSTWCLPNGMMLELKNKQNKRLGEQRELAVMVHTPGIPELGEWRQKDRRLKSSSGT